jgi:hypothetical protein
MLHDPATGAVVPESFAAERFVKVHIQTNGSSFIFPHGSSRIELAGVQPTQQDVASLDGQVLLPIKDTLFINDFSEGGGPGGSAPNLGPLPLAAGSASGDALVFFYGKNAADSDAYRDIRVVTTTLRGEEAGLREGFKALTPVFSIASTEKLPDQVPTLVILTNRDELADDSEVRIYHKIGTDFQEVPTYIAGDRTYAAIPLTGENGGTLVTPKAELNGRKRVERYVLGISRRDTQNVDTPTGGGSQSSRTA